MSPIRGRLVFTECGHERQEALSTVTYLNTLSTGRMAAGILATLGLGSLLVFALAERRTVYALDTVFAIVGN
jgi:hypothetical protein